MNPVKRRNHPPRKAPTLAAQVAAGLVAGCLFVGMLAYAAAETAVPASVVAWSFLSGALTVTIVTSVRLAAVTRRWVYRPEDVEQRLVHGLVELRDSKTPAEIEKAAREVAHEVAHCMAADGC